MSRRAFHQFGQPRVQQMTHRENNNCGNNKILKGPDNAIEIEDDGDDEEDDRKMPSNSPAESDATTACVFEADFSTKVNTCLAVAGLGVLGDEAALVQVGHIRRDRCRRP